MGNVASNASHSEELPTLSYMDGLGPPEGVTVCYHQHSAQANRWGAIAGEWVVMIRQLMN